MRKRSFSLIVGSLFVLALFSACQKDGGTGPEGPAGPQGPVGPKGDAGTANVIYSDWLDVEFIAVTAQNDDTDTLAFVADIPAPKLTSNIISTGEMKVYVNVGRTSQPVVYPLPLFDAYELTGIFNLNVTFSEGVISMYSTADASTFLVDNGDKAYQYRYVLIPGSVLALKPANIELNNYQEVQQYLKLKD